jgi:hypothetical protein
MPRSLYVRMGGTRFPIAGLLVRQWGSETVRRWDSETVRQWDSGTVEQ